MFQKMTCNYDGEPMTTPTNALHGTQRAMKIEYAIRDVVVPAMKLEEQGHEIIKLNIGDPIAYPGLPTPQHMVDAFKDALDSGKNGYSPSYGIPELRKAIASDERSKGWNAHEQDVYVTHGVTEALQIIFAATLEQGDEILAPGPHYPPYMAYPQMYGASTIEYQLKNDEGWSIDFDDIESKMNPNVKLFVLINPNNPCGTVCGQDEIDRLLQILRKYPQCMLIADEIYDGLDFSGEHTSAAKCSSDVPVFVLNGVSKVYYAPGWRIGYLALHDPQKRCDQIRDGIERILRSRLCASTPAQYGYLAGLEGPKDWMEEYQSKILKQRDYCINRIQSIEGLEVQHPRGAFYMFVKITHPKWKDDDKKFVLELLQQKHVLLVHGSGFSPNLGKGHFRLVYLANVQILERAFDKIEEFLSQKE